MTIPKSTTTVGRLLRASYGMRFFKTIKDQDENGNDIDYPAEEDNPTTYKARMLKNVSFIPQQGGFGLTYEETQKTDYIFNLEVEKYIEEGTVVLGFYFPGNTLEEGRWYTIDKVVEKEVNIDFLLCGHLQTRNKVFLRNSKGEKLLFEEGEELDEGVLVDEDGYKYEEQDGVVSRLDPDTGEVLWTIELGQDTYTFTLSGQERTHTNYRYPQDIQITADGYAYIIWATPVYVSIANSLQSFNSTYNKYSYALTSIASQDYFRTQLQVLTVNTKSGITKINSKGKIIWNLEFLPSKPITDTLQNTGARNAFASIALHPNDDDIIWTAPPNDINDNFLKKIDKDGNILKRIGKGDLWKNQTVYANEGYRSNSTCKIKLDNDGKLLVLPRHVPRINGATDPYNYIGSLWYVDTDTNEVLYGAQPVAGNNTTPLLASDGVNYGKYIRNTYNSFGWRRIQDFDYSKNKNLIAVMFDSSNETTLAEVSWFYQFKMHPDDAYYRNRVAEGAPTPYSGNPNITDVVFDFPPDIPLPVIANDSQVYYGYFFRYTNGSNVNGVKTYPPYTSIGLVVNDALDTVTYFNNGIQFIHFWKGVTVTFAGGGQFNATPTTTFNITRNFTGITFNLDDAPSLKSIENNPAFYVDTGNNLSQSRTLGFPFKGCSDGSVNYETYLSTLGLNPTDPEDDYVQINGTTWLNKGCTIMKYNPVLGTAWTAKLGWILVPISNGSSTYIKIPNHGLCCASRTCLLDLKKLKNELITDTIQLVEEDENTP